MSKLIHKNLALENGYNYFLKNLNNKLRNNRFYEFGPSFLTNNFFSKRIFLERYEKQGFQIRYREENKNFVSIVNPLFEPVFDYEIHRIPQKPLSYDHYQNYFQNGRNTVIKDDLFLEFNEKNSEILNAKEIYENVISNEKKELNFLVNEFLLELQKHTEWADVFDIESGISMSGYHYLRYCNKFLDKKTLEILDEYKKLGYEFGLVKPDKRDKDCFFHITSD